MATNELTFTLSDFLSHSQRSEAAHKTAGKAVTKMAARIVEASGPSGAIVSGLVARYLPGDDVTDALDASESLFLVARGAVTASTLDKAETTEERNIAATILRRGGGAVSPRDLGALAIGHVRRLQVERAARQAEAVRKAEAEAKAKVQADFDAAEAKAKASATKAKV